LQLKYLTRYWGGTGTSLMAFGVACVRCMWFVWAGNFYQREATSVDEVQSPVQPSVWDATSLEGLKVALQREGPVRCWLTQGQADSSAVATALENAASRLEAIRFVRSGLFSNVFLHYKSTTLFLDSADDDSCGLFAVRSLDKSNLSTASADVLQTMSCLTSLLYVPVSYVHSLATLVGCQWAARTPPPPSLQNRMFVVLADCVITLTPLSFGGQWRAPFHNCRR
jgi:hypothetical protein